MGVTHAHTYTHAQTEGIMMTTCSRVYDVIVEEGVSGSVSCDPLDLALTLLLLSTTAMSIFTVEKT